jgi:hypothetical protein
LTKSSFFLDDCQFGHITKIENKNTEHEVFDFSQSFENRGHLYQNQLCHFVRIIVMNFENHPPPQQTSGVWAQFPIPTPTWLRLVNFLGANFVVFGEKQIGEFLDKRVFLI